MVDAERAAAGLAGLAAEPRLDAAATGHARDMGERGFFGHTAPDPAPNGATIGERLAAAGYDGAIWGENLAAGHRTAAEVMSAWMNSASHREELLGSGFTELGVGIVTGPDGRVRWAQAFGRPAGAPEPTHPGPPVTGRASSRQLTVTAERRGWRIVVRGRLYGTGKGLRKIRVTAVRGTRAFSRIVRVRPGRTFAVKVRRPAGAAGVKVVVRLIGPGATAAPVRLTA